MPKTVRELLQEHITATQRRIDAIRAELLPLEREVADARIALAVIGDTDKVAEPNTSRVLRMTLPRPIRVYGGGEARDTEEAPQSPYAKLTMKQLVRMALDEHFQNGATANEMLELFHHAWGRNDVVRTSLSPQLSRLKREGVITLHGMKWRLVGQGDPDDLLSRNETGAPNGNAEDAPVVAKSGAATPGSAAWVNPQSRWSS